MVKKHCIGLYIAHKLSLDVWARKPHSTIILACTLPCPPAGISTGRNLIRPGRSVVSAGRTRRSASVVCAVSKLKEMAAAPDFKSMKTSRMLLPSEGHARNLYTTPDTCCGFYSSLPFFVCSLRTLASYLVKGEPWNVRNTWVKAITFWSMR